MRILQTITILSAIFLLNSCGGSSQESAQSAEGDESSSAETQAPETTEVTLSDAPGSPAYENAMLELTTPENGAKLPSGEPVSFAYDVTNYELMAQTPDADSKPLANSGKGQHIHVIFNNNPYYAKYEPEFDMELEDGHYVVLSFLSRSYHESVKNPEAFNVTQFTVGDGEPEMADLTAPHLFYSRPKGTYTGADTEEVLFDFFVVNASLSEDGYQVRVTVNGETEFMVDEWKPYVLKGLPMGENRVKIEMLDADGNLVDSPFNGEERVFTLEEAEMAS